MQVSTAEPVRHAVGETLELEPQQPARPLVVQQAQPVATTVTPADLLRIAMERDDKDLDRLERLMAMQERYEQAQERDRKRLAEAAFWRDFAGFKGENVIIPKAKLVDRGRAGSFMQAEFDDVCRRLAPALSTHGFGFRHDMKFGPKPWPTPENPDNVLPWVWVTCFLSHREGHIERLDLDGPADDQSANTMVQNMQSTASFLKRQSLLAITGTATGGEDDESRMRGRPARAEPAADAASASIVQQGEAEALNGMAALTKWWGTLNARERSQHSKAFGEMRKTARRVDAEAGHGE